MRFEGPFFKATGAHEFLAALGGILPSLRGYQFHKQFEDGDHVCAVYDLRFATPSGNTLVVPMVEWTRLRGIQIAEQRLYYDPRELMQAFSM